MKKVLVYLKDYRKECVLAPLFKMTEAIFELFVPLIIASIIDNGIGSANKGLLIRDFLLLVILGVVGWIVAITAQYFSAKAATGFATKLRHHLFRHLLSLSYTEVDTIGISTMITRMTSDINQAQNGVNMFLRLFLRSPFVVFGAMIMAFTIDVRCALTFVFAIVGLFVIVSFITVKNIQMLEVVQGKLDRVLQRTRENLVGVRVIRAFCREEREVEAFQNENGILAVEQKRAGSVSAFMNPLTYILINIAIILLIQTGAFQVSLGKLTQGEVVALYNYMSQILVELVKLANLIVTLSKAMASINRISDILVIDNSMENGICKSDVEDENMTEQYNVFDHVGLAYAGNSEESLSDISFTVKKGQTIGVIGGTGCGKTSLVHLLPRFYDVTSGNVMIAGKNVKEYDVDYLREKVSIVMQKAVLFKGTIRSNLLWRKETASDEELSKAIAIAQAADVVEAKGGLSGTIEQGGRNLSGGQKQRLSIARALVGEPDILILDDSSSALDYATDARLRKAIKESTKGMTTFIVSQRTASIQHADCILVLEDGLLVGKGTHQELLQSCEVYREIYESQYQVNSDSKKGGTA